jgi:signal transduction histidine kinase
MDESHMRTVSHELNNLLNIVINLSEVVASELPSGHPAQADLRSISEAGQHAAVLARELVLLSHTALNTRATVGDTEAGSSAANKI